VKVNEVGGSLEVNVGEIGEDVSKADDKILGLCLYLKGAEKKDVILATRDIILSIKAELLGIRPLDITDEKLIYDLSELYTGVLTINVESAVIDELHEKGFVDIDVLGIDLDKVFPNMGLVLKNGKTSHSSLGMDYKQYDRLSVSRPIQPLGNNDIGFIPGPVEEKLFVWMTPIQDVIEFLFGCTGKTRNRYYDLISTGILDIEPLAYIRGRSIPRTFFNVEEAQNCSSHELKTIISRMGAGSKIVLTGDIHQIDAENLDSTSNGLTCVAERFKPFEISGHITLVKGERSELANLAAELL
ncbi:hypothetical protein LCGC14_3035870, partial [marine sediment metagenome]